MKAEQKQVNLLKKRIRSTLEQNWDYLEALLGGSFFPRKAMAGFQNGQKIYFEKETLLNDFEASDFVDCFIASHSEMDKEQAILKVVFLDFDSKENIYGAIREAIKVADRIKKEYNVVPHLQFSGSKGCHLILPIEPLEFEMIEREKAFLHFSQQFLTTGSKYVDNQVFGDVSRLIRVPFTINSKALNMSWKGFVKILQEWNGNYANLSSLLELKNLDEEIRKSLSPKIKYVRIKKGIRKEVVKLIERAKQGVYLTHNQRLAILFELISKGYTDDEIVDVFKNQEDFDEKKTRYFISHARNQGYRPFTTERLQEILKEAD